MAQTILYYPTINIQDTVWLRNALLYWDNISSIVPYDNYPDFSPEILHLQKHGIYKPFFPQDLFSSEHAPAFTEAIIDKLERYSKRLSATHMATQNRPSVRVHRDKIYAPALHELIHRNKISPDLLRFFSDRHYINDYNCGGWMEIDANIASIYMKTLAEFIVKCYSEDIVIGTDKQKHLNQMYTYDRPRRSSACISLVLENCLPQPAMNIGFEEILDFKSRHKDELYEFRKKLREFEVSLTRCTEIEEIKFETERFKEAWQSALRQEQKLFSGKFVLGSLHTLIDTLTMSDTLEGILPENVSTPNSNIVSAILFGGAAAISLGCKFVNYRSKINEQRSSSGFSYIIKASKSGIITTL